MECVTFAWALVHVLLAHTAVWIAWVGPYAAIRALSTCTCTIRFTESRYVLLSGCESRSIDASTGVDGNIFQEEQPTKGWFEPTAWPLPRGSLHKP